MKILKCHSKTQKSVYVSNNVHQYWTRKYDEIDIKKSEKWTIPCILICITRDLLTKFISLSVVWKLCPCSIEMARCEMTRCSNHANIKTWTFQFIYFSDWNTITFNVCSNEGNVQWTCIKIMHNSVRIMCSRHAFESTDHCTCKMLYFLFFYLEINYGKKQFNHTEGARDFRYADIRGLTFYYTVFLLLWWTKVCGPSGRRFQTPV